MSVAKHHIDLILCRKLAGATNGKLCSRHDGCCCLCDSYIRPTATVRICDDCSHNNGHSKCIICGYPGSFDAFYCHECTIQEKDRDGCPRVTNLGSARTDSLMSQEMMQKRQANNPNMTPLGS